MHVVSDMSAHAGTSYEVSLCHLGIYGTNYIRDIPVPAQVSLAQGETTSFEVLHVYSELTIGTALDIALRQDSAYAMVTIVNGATSSKVTIDATGVEPGSYQLELGAFNKLSSV